MKTYITLLRGINVSGQKLIKMDALKKMYEKLGFNNIKTYLQSGNVIFSTENEDTNYLKEIITSQIKIEFGFDVPVLILNVKSLEQIIENNPFAKDEMKDKTHLHITFLNEIVNEFDNAYFLQKKYADEEIELTPHAIFLYCPHGYGNTKLTNNFIENKLKVTATTRNLKTCHALLGLAAPE